MRIRRLRRKASGNVEPPQESQAIEDANVTRNDEPTAAVGNDDQGVNPASNEDLWTITSDILIRHHRFPRTQLFSLSESGLDTPIPIKHIDVMRRTETDLDNAHEKANR